MSNIFSIRWHQFLEEVKQRSFQEAVRKTIAKCIVTDQIIVPVCNDLANLKQLKTEGTTSYEFVIISKTNLASVVSKMKATSRRLKLQRYTKAGYYNYAVISNGEIIGDIWCATLASVGVEPVHPDLPWLGIDCGENEAYMFDLYVAPDSRGKVTTSYLLTSALNHLKESGFNRVYGFYEKDNLPALWTHRMLGYAELGKRRSFRFLFYKKTQPVPAST